jgi:YYY domain-containing protein
MGFADESFSVYDHPKVLIFQNVENLGASEILRRIQDAAPPAPPPDPGENGFEPEDTRRVGLMLSPQDAEAQQSGGTWTDIVTNSGWTARFPVAAWLIVIEGIALLVLPIAFVLLRPLPDRGYLLAKPLGLLLVGLIVWLLGSTHLMAFSRESISAALLCLAAVSLMVLIAKRSEIVGFVRSHWRTLAVGEVVFLVAFAVFLIIRMANPDLWHPFRGGEKPMDLAYLNAVTKSTFFPPYDPWFAGGYINYYYWGQFLVGMLIRATGISSDIAFNLSVPMFFAMTAGGAFSVVYNLAEGTRRRLSGRADEKHLACPHLNPLPGRERRSEEEYLACPHLNPLPGRERGLADFCSQGIGVRLRLSPVAAGLAGVLFVVVIGNLDGAIQVGHGVWRVLFESASFGDFDFWRSSRMMPPDPPGFEITEFPFFTFLFADLHAHLMALPFTLLVIGIALAVVLGGVRRGRHWGAAEIARLVVLGIAVHSLRLLNTWDLPTYLLLGAFAIALGEYFAHGGLGFAPVVRAIAKAAIMFLAGFIAFLPYQLTYETFFNSVERTTNTTVLWQYLAITGLFVFIIGSYLLWDTRRWWLRLLALTVSRVRWLREAVIASESPNPPEDAPRVTTERVLTIILALLLIGFVATAAVSSPLGSTVPFLIAVVALGLVAVWRWLADFRPDAPYLAFAGLLALAAFCVSIGLDIVRVEGDIDRMNSVFKFYLQVWVMLALASAYLLWRLIAAAAPWSLRTILESVTPSGVWVRDRRGASSPLRAAWSAGLTALLISALVYPVLGTQDRLRDRFDGNMTPLTLDGAAYVAGATFRDENGAIDLSKDFEGIRWLRQNVEGSPVILEAVTPTYRWGGRVSIYTGLPAVFGWQWHQEQQRWDYRHEVAERIRDVNRIYETGSNTEALALLHEYGVRYVYLGQVERSYYSAAGLAKFDDLLGGALEQVFSNGETTIYRVRPPSP